MRKDIDQKNSLFGHFSRSDTGNYNYYFYNIIMIVYNA